MGGYAEAIDCPRCDGKETLFKSIDRDDVSAVCLECGYEYHTITHVMTLEEVNKERSICAEESLNELRKPKDGWVDPKEVST